MKPVALIGASGAVGIAIAAELSKQGRSYRAIGRDEAKLQALFGTDPLAEIRTWGGDAEAARQALEGVDAAVYLIGVNYWQFDLHPVLFKAALDGAVAAGVREMLLVGTVYPYGIPATLPIRESHPREPHTFKGRMRKEQEQLLIDAHARGDICGAVLRLPDLYGPGMEKSYLTSAFAAAPQGKRAQLLGPIDTIHEFAYIPDCARVAVRMLDEPSAFDGTWWNYGGPGTITTRDFAQRIYAACGNKPAFIVANKTMLRLFGLFDPLMRELVEMHYLLLHPVVMNDERLQALLGDLQKTSYDEGIRLTLEAQNA